MSEMDYLNYKPDFERDKKEKTGWIQDETNTHISQSETEDVHKGKELDITVGIKRYEEFKERFNQRVEELEKKLKDIEIPINETTEKALKEVGHTSTFNPNSYRDIFNKKESSVGEYLIGVLEKEVESENGSIDWEIFIEYLEIEEEIKILDYYIKEILLPIISKKNINLNDEKEIKELEKKWIEQTINNMTNFNIGQISYEIAMTTSPKEIARKRDELHDLEKVKVASEQEISQVNSSLFTVNQKRVGLEYLLREIDEILEVSIDESIVDDLIELTRNEKEETDSIKDSVILIKQAIDQDNNKKRELKHTRRNLYSKTKQKRIIGEYSSINQLFRENSLPLVHHMKSFQDNATNDLNKVFNQSAMSIDRNYNENNEKTYETYLLQISTTQTRMNRLEYVKSKQKSRLMFKELLDKYREIK